MNQNIYTRFFYLIGILLFISLSSFSVTIDPISPDKKFFRNSLKKLKSSTIALFPESSSSTESTTPLSFVGIECATTATSTITVSDNFIITDVNIGLNVSLDYRHHLTATITSPEGTTVELTSSGAYSGGSTSIHNWDVLFDDASSNSLNDGGSDDVAAPYYENERIANPSGTLSAFNGENSSGVWTLSVCDAVTSVINGGTVNRWKIDIEGTEESSGGEIVLVNNLTCSANSTEISGTVFEDYNFNGIYDSTIEPYGVAGVVVSATDNTGSVVTTATSATGTYSFGGLTSGQIYRIEFSFPDSVSWANPTKYQGDNGTTIQFVQPGNCANLGAAAPGDYCEDANPPILISCFEPGNAVYGSTGNENKGIVGFPYNSSGTITPNEVAKIYEVGTVWGLAWQASTQRMFSGAFLKRHSGFGPEGPGGVYVTDYSNGTGAVVHSFDLQGVSPDNGGPNIDLGTVDRSSGADFTLHDDNSTDNYDIDAFANIGKISYGDVDISLDGKTLWLTNLNQQALISVDITDSTSYPGTVNQYRFQDMTGVPSCTNGVLRPWGLAMNKGKGYVGCVCTGENSGSAANMHAYVLSFDQDNPTAFTTELDFPLDYTRENAIDFSSLTIGTQSGEWRPWADTWGATGFGTSPLSELAYAQPILSDLDFLDDGSMVLGFSDRWGFQMGYENLIPVSGSSSLTTGDVAGDIVKACYINGAFVLEGTGSCSVNDNTTNSTLDNDGPSNNGEFFYADGFDDFSNSPTYNHNETFIGSLGVLRGTNQVVAAHYDPLDGSGFAFDLGLIWHDASTGAKDRALRIIESGAAQSKGNNLGDLALVCEAAPIEIGNYVWLDIDADGVQDPSEMGLAGIRMELYDANGTLIAFDTTDANGQYYFSKDRDGSQIWTTSGGQLGFGQDYYIAVSSSQFASDELTLGIDKYNLTVDSTNNTTNPTLIDNDAEIGSGYSGGLAGLNSIPITALRTGFAGENDHTFDIGFKPLCNNPTASIFAIQNSCTNGVVDVNTAYIQLSAISNGDRFAISTGSTFIGNTDYSAAMAIGSTPDTLLQGLANPSGSQAYTIRVFNGASNCFTDVVVTLNEQDCTVGCDCEEYIYLNDVSIDAVHKFQVASNGALTEIGSPWIANNTINNPHGLAVDLNGNLVIGQADNFNNNVPNGPVFKLDCDGNILDTDILNPVVEYGYNFFSKDGILYTFDNNSFEVKAYDLCDGSYIGAMGYVASAPLGINWGMYIDDTNWYLADYGNDRVMTGPLEIALFSDPATNSGSVLFSLDAANNRPLGITRDVNGNFFIVDGNPGNPQEISIFKYSATGTLITSITDNVYSAPPNTTDGVDGFYGGRGITYSPTANLLYFGSFENCISVFDTNLVQQTALNIGNPEPTAPKGIAITKECCPTNNNLTVDTMLCAASLNDQIFLQELINCDGVICEGIWEEGISNSGLTYNPCDNSVTVDDLDACGSFTLESDGVGNNPKCGAFKIKVNISVNVVTASVVAANQTVCLGGDPAAFTVATPSTGGTLTYQWQSSTDSLNGYADIPGAISDTYDPPSGLMDATFYRVIVNSTNAGCALGNCADTSNVISVQLENCCTNPTASIFAIQNSCTNGVVDANTAYIQLSAVSNGDKFAISTGSTFTGNTDYSAATIIGSTPDTLLQGLANPSGSQAYTIRVFNGESDCYTDVVVTLNEQDCAIGCNCTEKIYLNETTTGGSVHKFSISSNGTLTEIGMPWFDNTVVGEDVVSPHGIGSDLNGYLYIGESNDADNQIRRFTCDGEIIPESTFGITTAGQFNFGSIGNTLYIGERDYNGIVAYDLCSGTEVGRLEFCEGNGNAGNWGFYIDPITKVMYATTSQIAWNRNRVYIFTEDDFSVSGTPCISETTAFSGDPTGNFPPRLAPGENSRVLGVTTDTTGNVYIVVYSDDRIVNSPSYILKYGPGPAYAFQARSMLDSLNDGTGFREAHGIVYSKTANRIYVSTNSPVDDCVSVFDTDLNYLDVAVPPPGDSSRAKGIAILEECCPTNNNVTVDTTLCVTALNDIVFLQNLVDCSGTICEGLWTEGEANTGLTYNSCNNSITINALNACGTFILESDGVGNNPQCGAFKIRVNINIGSITAPIYPSTPSICEGTTPTQFAPTTQAIGSGDIAYQWQSSSDSLFGYSNIGGATDSVYTPVSAITDTTYYRVIASVAGGCSSGNCTDTSSIIRLTLDPLPDLATTDTTICIGTNIDLNNRVVDNSGLSGTLTIHSNSTDAISGSSPIINTANPVMTTRYYFRKVTDAHNCVDIDSTLITVQAVPDLATNNQTICAGESVNLSTLVTDNASTSGTITYHNNLADAETGVNNLGSNLTPSITTKYYIRKHTTTGNCIDIDSLIITIQPLPALATTAATICAGTSIDLNNQVVDNNSTTGSQTFFLSMADLNAGSNIQSNPVSPSTSTKYYVRKITDAESCQDVDSLTITIQPLPDLDTRDTTICSGQSVDLAGQTIDAASTVGTMTYHATLADAQSGGNVLTSTTVNPIADSKYYVRKITTTANCLDLDSIAITIQPNPDLVTIDSIICNGITIDIAGLVVDNAGTTGTMTYHNSLADAQSGGNALGGTNVNPSVDTKYYIRKVTTTANCVDLDSVAITVQPNPDLSTTDETICAGVSIDLTGQVTDNNSTVGTMTFHNSLADAQGGTGALGSTTVSPLATTKYYVLKNTTIAACTAIDSLTITVQPLPDLATRDSLVCADTDLDIAALVTDNEGTTGTVSYHNTLADAQSGSNALGSSTVNTSTSSKYYIRKSTTTANCPDVDSLTITRQLLPELVTKDSTICATDAVDLAGLLTGNAGTTGTVTFHVLFTDAQLGVNALGSSIVSPNSSTTYHIRKETTTGSCYSVESLVITVQPNPDLVSTDATICNGASVDLSGQVTDNASTTGTMTYHTNLADAQSVANPLGSTIVSPTSTTKYYIQKTTTSASCQDIDSLTITVQPLPDLLTSDVTICEGISIDLIGQVSDNNATIGTTTFHNTLADAQSASNTLGSSSVSPSTTTKYYVSKVTTTASCTDVDSITITVQPLPELTTQNDTLCVGESVDISTLVTDVASTAGTMSYHASLTDAQGNSNPLGSTTVSPTTTTKYYIRKETTTASCTDIDSLMIVIEPLPDLSTTDTDLCAGESVDLATLATHNAGLIGFMTYHTSLADAQSGASPLGSTTVTPVSTTKYYVRKIAGTQTCLDVDSINVTINPLPTDAANPVDGAYCEGSTIATLQVDDPGAGFNVIWWNASTGGSLVTGATLGGARNEQITLSASSSPAAPVDGNTTTIYAEIVNTTTNCVSAGRVAVTLTNHELPEITSITPMVCSGDVTTLSATVTKGTLPYGYSWAIVGSLITPFNGGTAATSTEAMPEFDASAIAPGTYMIQLTLTDANGCIDVSTFNFTVQAGPDATFTNLTSMVCAGDMGVVYAVEDQGVGASYSWTFTNASVVSGGMATDTFIVVNWDQGGTTGNINVNITLASDCTGQNQTVVSIHPKPVLTAASNSPICAGDTLKLSSTTSGGTAGFNYAWTGPNTFSANVENPIIAEATIAATGSYEVIVTDVNTCADTATVAATVEQVPDLATRDTTICPNEPVDLSSLYVDNNGTTGTTTYYATLADAQTPANAISATVMTATSARYYIRKSITNVPNCTAIDSLDITIQPNPDLSTTDDLICNGASVDLSTLVTDNAATTGTITYHNSLADAQNGVGDIGNNQSPTTTTKYFVLKTTSTVACTNIDSLIITVQDLPDLVTLDSTICENETIELTGLVMDNAGTIGTTTFHTDLAGANTGSGAIASAVTPANNTKYYVRKETTAGDCFEVDSMLISLQTMPNLSTRDTLVCEGQSVELTNLFTDAANTVGTTTFHTSRSDAESNSAALGSILVTPNFTSKYYLRKATTTANCVDFDSIMVSIQTLPDLAGSNALICSGESVDLSTLVTDNAGTTGTLSYHNSLVDAQNGVNAISGTQSPTINTEYFILKTTTNASCIDIVSIMVNVQVLPDLVLKDSTICAGQSANLSTLVTDNAETTGDLTFHTTHADAVAGTGTLATTVSPLGTTKYYVRKNTTGSNCLATDSLTITIQPNPDLVTTDSLICAGESVDLSGLVSDAASTVGTLSFYGSLADAQGAINALGGTNVTPGSTTKFYVRKETTMANCSDLDSLIITIQDLPDLATTNQIICAGQTVDLNTLVTDNAMTTGLVTYHNSLADAQSGINDIGNSQTPANDTKYYVLKTTAAGACTNIDSLNITVQPLPDLMPRDTTICSAELVDLNTLVTDNAGTVGTTTFHNLLTDANSGTDAISTSVTPNSTTKYYIRKVTTTANCPIVDSLTVNVVLLADLVTRDSSICTGESVDLATLFIDNAGTTGTMAYYATLADANAGTNAISSTVTPGSNTKYYLSKTIGAQNCISVDSIEISLLPLPDLATSITTVCPSGSVDLSTLVTDNAGTLGTTTYHISMADALSSSNNIGANQNPATTTKYYIRKISTNNCLDYDSVTVIVQDLPDLSVLPGSICSGGDIDLKTLVTDNAGTVGDLTCHATLEGALNGTAIIVGTVSPTTETKYYFRKETTTAGCVTVDSVTVSILPDANIIGRDTALCNGFTLDLKSLLNGTVSGSIKYGTSFGAYPDTISTLVTVSGTQTYFIENDIGGGCTDTTRLTITALSCDLGDLPDSSATTNNADYQTLLANNGPVHVIIPGLSLGATVDGELDGQPSDDALGDGDDEDGLTIFSTLDLKPGITFKLPLSVTNTTSDTAYVEAWIDWNGDGKFDGPNEMVWDLKDNADGNFPPIISTTVPANATSGLIGVRIRVSNSDNMTPYGYQATGEIEDYLIGIECPSIICIPATYEINRE